MHYSAFLMFYLVQDVEHLLQYALDKSFPEMMTYLVSYKKVKRGRKKLLRDLEKLESVKGLPKDVKGLCFPITRTLSHLRDGF